jgi:predicted MPP superfamily phosphohydrolase
MSKFDRRGFIKLAGLGGGIVFASSLNRGLGLNALGSVMNYANGKVNDDFYFVQLSDTHWGFSGPKVNPDAEGTLKKAVQAVNSLEEQPDFIVFTGDLTHTTDDVQVRKDRMSQFKDIVGQLTVPTVHFMAGEHDASLDRGEAYQEAFGKLNYTFDHKGVHFIVLDNVSDPGAIVGESQLNVSKPT